MTHNSSTIERSLPAGLTTKDILDDYRIAYLSRQLSLLGRKEVLTGKAKFGIFGDGKEIAQVAMARQFRNGDWRSGYYRDQTFMLAAGLTTPVEFFSQLYGDTDTSLNPGSSGRSFNNHYSTPVVDEEGKFLKLAHQKNAVSDIAPTAGQMPRLLGLAYASKLYRSNPELHAFSDLSVNGNEVAFGMIGDSSCAEGHFFETMNAAGVLQVPMAIAVWDDGYGISVPIDYQIVKKSISEALSGFGAKEGSPGIGILKVKGWDYPALVDAFARGIARCREEHVPTLFHIVELTQPLGHSTSGSHERYKSKERLQWEHDFDALAKTREWILEHEIAHEEELARIEEQAHDEALAARDKAWSSYIRPLVALKNELLQIIDQRSCRCTDENMHAISQFADTLREIQYPIRRDIFSTAKKIIRHVCKDCERKKTLKLQLTRWLQDNYMDAQEKYSSCLYTENHRSALNVPLISPVYSPSTQLVNGREIIRDNYDKLLEKYPTLSIFGEDVGKIGGVNQTLEGLQQKYGEIRVTDTGIRETTIVGQAIGMALRGLRPIAEIQYFDYLLYALQTLSDDVACLHWRTKGRQAVPLIISTRGHRLEGIWHSGSPLSMVINSIRGIYICVPRDMTRAAGFYNTLLQSNDPALVIEPLNGYRLKEPLPENLGEYTLPLGVPEVLVEGTDITLVTYGSCVRIAKDAVDQLAEFGISVELIDVQTLLPFDIHHLISRSIQKTRKVLFFDEDVPGGATAFMMQEVIEGQEAWKYLVTGPKTLSAQEHRPAYSSDGDYFSNPNAEDVFETVYEMMRTVNPDRFPSLYKD